jgi:hypothetical protein
MERELEWARILSTGEPVNMERRGNRVFLTGLPPDPPDPLSTVIVLQPA